VMGSACRWCGDPAYTCKQTDNDPDSCGWLLVAEDTFSADVLKTKIQRSAACVLLRTACCKHSWLIHSMTQPYDRY
jgi:hypothetical protein